MAINLKECAFKGKPLVIKNALRSLGLKRFGQFLKERMKYSNDDRQFNLENYCHLMSSVFHVRSFHGQSIMSTLNRFKCENLYSGAAADKSQC